MEPRNAGQERATSGHPQRTPRPAFPGKLSTYYLPNEIRRTHDGMLLAIPDPHLRAAFGTQTPEMIARTLFDLALRVPWRRFLTNPWTPKPSERPRKTKNPPDRHVSVQRLLEAEKNS